MAGRFRPRSIDGKKIKKEILCGRVSSDTAKVLKIYAKKQNQKLGTLISEILEQYAEWLKGKK